MDEQIDKFVDLIFDFNMKDLEDETKLLENYKKLQQENQQLKIQVSSREEVANKYKKVIDEVREYIKKHPCDTWYYTKKKSTKLFDLEIIRCDKELLQILDKGADK